MHHFCFSIVIGKPYVIVWRLQRQRETQQHPKTGERLVTRFSFGWFRLEYSTYVLTF